MRHGSRAVLLSVLLLASAPLSAQATLFRVSDLDLRDPHVFATFLSTCIDFTDTGVAGFSVNAQLQAAIQGDADGDGFLDQSYVLEFLPLDQSAATNLFVAGEADCTAPIADTRCLPIEVPQLAGDAALSATGTCATFLPGTVRPYSPAITSSFAPCFASPAGDITLNLGGLLVPLTDAQVAARFVGDPATSMTSGLLRGFLSEAAADATIVPSSVPVFGGRPLSSLLPGGTNTCAAFSDKDLGPDGVTGWYFYLNFTANRVLAETFGDGFADGFE